LKLYLRWQSLTLNAQPFDQCGQANAVAIRKNPLGSFALVEVNQKLLSLFRSPVPIARSVF
jgi:hypothetical protein